MTLPEVLAGARFCAWSALVIAPVIDWLQGESVSHDQFVVRTGLVVIAAVLAAGLRCRAIVARRRHP